MLASFSIKNINIIRDLRIDCSRKYNPNGSEEIICITPVALVPDEWEKMKWKKDTTTPKVWEMF